MENGAWHGASLPLPRAPYSSSSKAHTQPYLGIASASFHHSQVLMPRLLTISSGFSKFISERQKQHRQNTEPNPSPVHFYLFIYFSLANNGLKTGKCITNFSDARVKSLKRTGFLFLWTLIYHTEKSCMNLWKGVKGIQRGENKKSNPAIRANKAKRGAKLTPTKECEGWKYLISLASLIKLCTAKKVSNICLLKNRCWFWDFSAKFCFLALSAI